MFIKLVLSPLMVLAHLVVSTKALKVEVVGDDDHVKSFKLPTARNFRTPSEHRIFQAVETLHYVLESLDKAAEERKSEHHVAGTAWTVTQISAAAEATMRLIKRCNATTHQCLANAEESK